MSNHVTCRDCGHDVLSRDIHHADEAGAVCMRCFVYYGYAYVGTAADGSPRFEGHRSHIHTASGNHARYCD